MKPFLKSEGIRTKEVYIYAETAFSHEGNLDYLFQLVDEAARTKADGIKFQILKNPEESYAKDILENASWKEWIFTDQEWKGVIQYAHNKKGLDIILLPIDMQAVEFCEENKELYDMIEVHSVNFNHKQMLERIDHYGKTVILGIGGRTIADIEYALMLLKKSYGNKEILLMHGFQSFPTKQENIKLERIRKLKSLYDLEVGYADHTAYNKDDLSLIQFAYLNGARFFEKHIVIEKGKERTDYQAAVNGEHFIEIRERLKDVITIQGGMGALELSEAEWAYRGREKKIIALRDIFPGETFTTENIGYKVTNQRSSYEQREIECILGKVSGDFIKAESSGIVVRAE